ncbi:MAG: hypothetical protein A2176_14245 [Spirochaetes bacterium RBG_13_51_14]|nr:MAG: hypothetical protein A2176_14245 [Spirochaetes bacterium RBG_13_51_14]
MIMTLIESMRHILFNTCHPADSVFAEGFPVYRMPRKRVYFGDMLIVIDKELSVRVKIIVVKRVFNFTSRNLSPIGYSYQ